MLAPWIGGGRRADAAGDVVVAGEDVGHERPEHVERRAVAERRCSFMLYSIWSNGTWPGPFDHDLHALAPGALGELAERLELRELRRVGRVGEATRAQAVADRERHVVRRMTSQMSSHMRVHRVLRPWTSIHFASSEPPRDTMPMSGSDERQVLAQHARVDREVVDALLRLMLAASRGSPRRQVLDLAADDHRVDRHGADGHVDCATIASRQASRSPPVERSITVSAPQRSAHFSFSTSSSVPLETGSRPCWR
jgi:hypothetical protein